VKDKHHGIIVSSPDMDFRALALRVHQEISRAGVLTGSLLAVKRSG